MRGGVFKRGKTWSYTVFLGRDPVTGKKKYKQVGGFATRRACEDALRKVVDRVRVGDYADAGSTTLAEFIERWLDAVAHTVRPTTLGSYRSMLTLHVGPRIGHRRLDKVTGLDIGELYAVLLTSGYCKGARKGQRGLSHASVRYLHRILHRMFSDALRWGLLARSPLAAVDPPAKVEVEMRTWTAEQVRSFLRLVENDRLYAMWVVFCTTGMRRGEVIGLTWSDIDLQRGCLSVQRALVEVDGWEVRIAEPKSARSRRSIALDATTVELLRQHRTRQLQERLRRGTGDHADLVFDRLDGSPMQPQSVTQTFDLIVRRARLPRIRLHDLRHTAATIALANGVHPKVVSERLGHSSVQLTLDKYSHVVEGLQEDAAQRLGALIFSDDDLDGPSGTGGPST